jgi:hypothetical protein
MLIEMEKWLNTYIIVTGIVALSLAVAGHGFIP